METSQEQYNLANIKREADRRKKQERDRQLYAAFYLLIKAKWDDLKPMDRNANGQENHNSDYEYFADVYSLTRRQVDKEEIEKIKTHFSDRGKISQIAEYILMQGIFDLQWLSEDVEVFPTHEYDDIKSGIDLALRFEHPEQGYTYLGIDVKAWNDSRGIEFERSKVLRELSKGELSELKYFDDPAAGVKGKQKMPKIIIVFNPYDATKLQEVMLKLVKKRELNSIKNVTAEQKEIINKHKDTLASYIDKPLFPEEERFLADIKIRVERQIKNQVKEIIDYLQALILNNPAKKDKYEQCLVEYQKVAECWQ